MEAFAKDMNSNLFGNPHSGSPSSMLSTQRVEYARLEMLKFFKADPNHFDLIFVANATAAIKLVVDCMTDYSRQRGPSSFRYTFHRDSHTSLVGPREVACHSACFASDSEVDRWLSQGCNFGNDSKNGKGSVPALFAYPAQSNMTGRRLPLDWAGRLRTSAASTDQEIYTLLDAAAFVSTAQLDLSDDAKAPDFTALSFYKIFGFPDLGALIVRKKSGHVLRARKYFGGGTVDMVIVDSDSSKEWYARKQVCLHEMVEDGTPPFHSIIALESALRVHRCLFGSMGLVSQYTSALSGRLYESMARLTYNNGRAVCKVYGGPNPAYGDSQKQGPTIAFNVQRDDGSWVGKSEFENAAIQNGIQLRTGGVCNPGGIATALDLSPKEMRENYMEGVRCGNEIDEMHGKPTGIIRVSLGAMSSLKDIQRFITFLKQFAGVEDNTLSKASRKSNHVKQEKDAHATARMIQTGSSVSYPNRASISLTFKENEELRDSTDDIIEKAQVFDSQAVKLVVHARRGPRIGWMKHSLRSRLRY